MNPNISLQLHLARVIDSGKKDDVATRWAKAFQTVCPDPVQLLPTAPVDVYLKALPEVREHLASPFLNRVALSKVAEVVITGKSNEEAAAWSVAVQGLEL